jgi:hypothetical protein
MAWVVLPGLGEADSLLFVISSSSKLMSNLPIKKNKSHEMWI